MPDKKINYSTDLNELKSKGGSKKFSKTKKNDTGDLKDNFNALYSKPQRFNSDMSSKSISRPNIDHNYVYNRENDPKDNFKHTKSISVKKMSNSISQIKSLPRTQTSAAPTRKNLAARQISITDSEINPKSLFNSNSLTVDMVKNFINTKNNIKKNNTKMEIILDEENIHVIQYPKYAEGIAYEFWYHGYISPEKTLQLLKFNGDFFVSRECNNFKVYIIHGIEDNRLVQIKLFSQNETFNFCHQEYKSISEFVNTYFKTAAPLVSDEGDLFLLKTPITKISWPENLNFFKNF